MRERRSNSARFQRVVSNLNSWLEANRRAVTGNIDPTWFVTSSTLILTLAAFVYLDLFYGEFGINYFRFYAFEDAIRVLYEKGALFFISPLVIIIASLIMGGFLLLFRSDLRMEISKNTIAVFSVITSGVITGITFKSFFGMHSISSIVIGLLTGIVLIMVFYFDLRMIFALPFVLGFALIVCAIPDARKRIREKIRFNLVQSDGKTISSITQNGNTTWIGTTSRIMYLYNDSTRMVTELPISEIQSISYSHTQ